MYSELRVDDMFEHRAPATLNAMWLGRTLKKHNEDVFKCWESQSTPVCWLMCPVCCPYTWCVLSSCSACVFLGESICECVYVHTCQKKTAAVTPEAGTPAPN